MRTLTRLTVDSFGDYEGPPKLESESDDDQPIYQFPSGVRMSDPARGQSRITKARVKVQISEKCFLSCVVALDSCCSVSVFSPGFARPLEGKNDVKAVAFGGQSLSLGSRAELTLVRRDGSCFFISGHNATDASHLPSGCVALISKDDIAKLNIALDFHVRYRGPSIPDLRILRNAEIEQKNEVFLAESNGTGILESGG